MHQRGGHRIAFYFGSFAIIVWVSSIIICDWCDIIVFNQNSFLSMICTENEYLYFSKMKNFHGTMEPEFWDWS